MFLFVYLFFVYKTLPIQTIYVCVWVNQRNLTELIVAVDVGNLLQLYASMLFERRILIFASKLSTVSYKSFFYFCSITFTSVYDRNHT